MSNDGTERIILRRTPEDDVDAAVERLRRRRWDRSGSGTREVCLQYDFGNGISRSIFGETFDALLPLSWEEWDEETGVRVLQPADVPAALTAIRTILRRPRTLARKMSEVLAADWSAETVRSLLRRYRKDPDASGAETDGERVLQVAAQLQLVLEKAAKHGHAVVESSGERHEVRGRAN